jgi:hypothetical protein
VSVQVACGECSRLRQRLHVFTFLRTSHPLLFARSHLIDASAPPCSKVLGLLHTVAPAPEVGELDYFVHAVVFGVPALFGGNIVVPGLLLEAVVYVRLSCTARLVVGGGTAAAAESRFRVISACPLICAARGAEIGVCVRGKAASGLHCAFRRPGHGTTVFIDVNIHSWKV